MYCMCVQSNYFAVDLSPVTPHVSMTVYTRVVRYVHTTYDCKCVCVCACKLACQTQVQSLIGRSINPQPYISPLQPLSTQLLSSRFSLQSLDHWQSSEYVLKSGWVHMHGWLAVSVCLCLCLFVCVRAGVFNVCFHATPIAHSSSVLSWKSSSTKIII